MTDDIVTRLREVSCDNRWCGNDPHCRLCDAADEIERLRRELSKWATTPPNRIVCATHGEMFMCFDGYMGGVYWCDGCRND